MKKIKARWLRWKHLMKHTFMREEVHMAYSEGVSYYFCGIEVWFKSKKIGCTCGRTWYKTKNKK